MGNWFDGLDLGVKYAIGLAILFTLVVIFAVTKLVIQKRKIRKLRAEAASRAVDEESKLEQTALTNLDPGEGDLFGIRAIEKGFYGGVAQSQPATPTMSMVSLQLPYGNTRPHGSSATLVGTSPTPGQKRAEVEVNMNQTISDSAGHGGKFKLGGGHTRTASSSPSTSPHRQSILQQPAAAYVATPRVVVTEAQPAPLVYTASDRGRSRSTSPEEYTTPRGTPSPPALTFTHPAITHPPVTQGENLEELYAGYYREGVARGEFNFAGGERGGKTV